MKIDCCTKDCPDRCADPNCHTYCKRYLEQRAELDRTNAEQFKRSQVESGITGTLVKSANKVTQRRHRGEKNKR